MNIVAYCFRCKRKVQMVKVLKKKKGNHNRNSYIGQCDGCQGEVSVIRQEH